MVQDKVRELRERKGLSIHELASSSGVSAPYLRQIESGLRKNPSGEVLKRLASALGATVADLLGTSTAIPEESLKTTPPALQSLIREKGEQLGLRQEDVEMLRGIHFRGRQAEHPDDWELIFLFLKRLLG